MLVQIVESFISKAGEKLADYAENTVRGIKDYGLTLENLGRNLKLLSDKASVVEQEIKNAELSGKKKRKREVENWLKEVQKIESEIRILKKELPSERFISKFLGGDRAAKLNARVCDLVEQSQHFGEVLYVKETKGEALLTTRLVGEASGENSERIWKFLVTDKVPCIGIYGMRGVGKTTLAKRIHNRLLEETDDCCVFWVKVSRTFSTKKLQDEIADVIGLDLSDEHNEDKRAARLNRALSLRKNFVLILDDVRKNISLDKVGNPICVEGCRLMITTRSLEVCRRIGCKEVIAVEKLLADEAWNLFSETLGRETILTPEVQEIAKSMVKECDGLPLRIITLAGSMRGETAIHVWRNAMAERQQPVTNRRDNTRSRYQQERKTRSPGSSLSPN